MIGRVAATTDGLLKDTNDIEILVVEQDTLPLQVMRDYALLFTDWLRATVNFLEQNLHKVGLAHG